MVQGIRFRCRSAAILGALLGAGLFAATNYGPASDFQYRQFVSTNAVPVIFNYRLFLPRYYQTNGTQKHPVVIFLHGAGEKEANAVLGNAVSANTAQMADNGQFIFTKPPYQSNFPCFMILPNSGSSGFTRCSTNYPEMVRLLANEFRIDLDRVFITGLSFGGQGTLYAAIDQADFYAGAIALSPPTTGNLDQCRRLTNLPLWIFHAANDATIAVTASETMYHQIRSEGVSTIFTRYNTGAHAGGTWPAAYGTPALLSWMKSLRKGIRTPGPVDIGFDTLPESQITVVTNRTMDLAGTTRLWTNQDPQLTVVERTYGINDDYNPRYAIPLLSNTSPWSFPITMTMTKTNFMTVAARGTTWSAALGGTNFYSSSRLFATTAADITAPILTLPGNVVTNVPVTVKLKIDERAGYWSTNGIGGPYFLFEDPYTNLTFSNTTTLTCYGQDDSGNRSATYTRTFTIDRVAPVISGIPSNFTTNAPFAVTLSVNENSGYLSTNGAAGPFMPFGTNGTNVTIQQTTTLYYYTKDLAGNVSATNTRTYTIQPGSPVPTLSMLPLSQLTNADVQATLVPNGGTGYWSTNGVSFQVLPPAGTNLVITTTASIWGYAVSNAVTGPTNRRDYTLDRLPPVISGLPDSCTTNGPFGVSLSFNEGTGYLSTNALTGPYTPFPAAGTNLNLTQTRSVWVFGRDPAGNTGATNSRLYSIQTILPPPVVSVTPASLATNRDFQVVLAVDRNFGFWSTDGTHFNPFGAAGTNLWITSNTTLWTYGSSNGSCSPTNTVSYILDKTAPVISGIPPSLMTNQTLNLRLSLDENWGYVSTNGPAGGWCAFGTNGTNLTIDRDTTLHYYACDDLGNASATHSVTYGIDRRIPVVSVSHDSSTNNTWFLLSLGVDRGTGFFSTNGSPFIPFPTGGTNLLIRTATELLVYGKDAYGNTSATNRKTWVESSDPQYFEAEWADGIHSNFLITSNSQASGGQAIGTTNGIQKLIPPSLAIPLEYRFKVDAAGRYYLWGKTLAASGNDNSFFVAMDQGPTNVWDFAVSTNFTWGAALNTNRGRLAFDLVPGWHTFSVLFREDGAWVDTFCLSSTSNFNPATNSQVAPLLSLSASSTASNGELLVTLQVSSSTPSMASTVSPLRNKAEALPAAGDLGETLRLICEYRISGHEGWKAIDGKDLRGARDITAYGATSFTWTGVREPWLRYDLRLSAVSESGTHSTLLTNVQLLTGIPPVSDLKQATLLNNPWRGAGPVVLLHLPEQAKVNVFSVSGRWIAELPGSGVRSWEPAAPSHRPLPAGSYVVRIDSGSETRFLTLLVTP